MTSGPLFDPWVLTLVLVVWIVVPLSLALYLFNRRDI